jgi:3D (Asp-Asp-Asp) domain-containing protein
MRMRLSAILKPYSTYTTHMKKYYLLLSFVCSLVHPFSALALREQVPYEQDFIITAYYSPEPDQCCYVKGSYAADVVLNGEGTHGADGTAVIPGMAAAPKSYAFGTTIILPGIGTVRVHDRGGAIHELPDGAHRLDLWVGKGEEGLARALAFGVQRVRGTIYPLGTQQPKMALDLSSLSAPLNSIKRLPWKWANAVCLYAHYRKV